MKKFLFIIFFFFTINTVNAVELSSDFDSLTNKDCFTDNSSYYLCTSDWSAWYLQKISIFTQTWELISNTEVLWNDIIIVNVLQTLANDYLTVEYNNSWTFSYWLIIINKLDLTFNATTYHNWFCYDTSYRGLNYVNNWTIELVFRDCWSLYNKFTINTNEYTYSTWSYINEDDFLKFSKANLTYDYLIYKDTITYDLTLSTKVDDVFLNTTISNWDLTNYNYRVWVYSNAFSYVDNDVWTTSVFNISINDYDVVLSELSNTWGIVYRHLWTDSFWIINNDEINFFDYNLYTPLFTINDDDLYFLSWWVLNIVWKQSINLIWWDTSTWTITNTDFDTSVWLLWFDCSTWYSSANPICWISSIGGMIENATFFTAVKSFFTSYLQLFNFSLETWDYTISTKLPTWSNLLEPENYDFVLTNSWVTVNNVFWFTDNWENKITDFLILLFFLLIYFSSLIAFLSLIFSLWYLFLWLVVKIINIFTFWIFSKSDLTWNSNIYSFFLLWLFFLLFLNLFNSLMSWVMSDLWTAFTSFKQILWTFLNIIYLNLTTHTFDFITVVNTISTWVTATIFILLLYMFVNKFLRLV